ncbi:MAG: hypothetical protein R3A80_12285 [Bdellovibrionota bacterium]
MNHKTNNPFKLTLFSVLAVAAMNADAGRMKTLPMNGLGEIVPSSFAKKVGAEASYFGAKALKNSGKNAITAGQSALSSASHVAEGVYVPTAAAINLALRIGLGSDVVDHIRSNRMGLMVTGPIASQNILSATAATAQNAGLAVYQSTKFAAYASGTLLRAAEAGTLQIFKASMYTADAVTQIGKEWVLKPTYNLIATIWNLSEPVAKTLFNTASGVVKGATSIVPGAVGGLFNGIFGHNPVGDALEGTASKMRSSSGRSFKRAAGK